MAIYRMEDHPLSGVPLDTISYAGNAPFPPVPPHATPCLPLATLLLPLYHPCHPLICYPSTTPCHPLAACPAQDFWYLTVGATD